MKRRLPHILVRMVLINSVISIAYFVALELLLDAMSDYLFTHATLRGVTVGAMTVFIPLGVILGTHMHVIQRRIGRAVRAHDGAVCTRCLFPLTPNGRCNECGLEMPVEEAQRLFRRYRRR